MLRRTLPAKSCLLLAIGICGGSYAATTSSVFIRHDRDLAAAVDLAAPFTMTVTIGGGCGTLIDGRWVITAAHVARGISPLDPYVDVEGTRHRIARVVVHPEGVSDGRRPPRVDLALLELEAPIEGIAPADLYEGDGERGRPVVVVGYGDFGRAGERPTRFDGQRRAATNIVEDANDRHVVIVFDEPPAGTELEGVGAPGDSGGPLLMEADGKTYIVGVSSASMGGQPGSYGVRDLYVRVSRFTDWIARTMQSQPEPDQLIPAPHDVRTGGFPATDLCTIASAFVEQYNAADEETLAEFSRQHRLEGARRDRPDAAWATMIKQRHHELGSLQAEYFAEVPRGADILLRNPQTGQAFILHLLIQRRNGELKLDGQRFRELVRPDSNHVGN